ncbi:MAG TPA: hypothetical protein VM120_24870 [Bryobacteraceae bacterium]|nr:hypothetical protein [Bryobacteraceae bacterium]
MNPFDLTGPQFLVFYFVFASLILVTLDQLRRAREGGTVDARLTDPYQIAYLRGGKQAAIQTALVADRSQDPEGKVRNDGGFEDLRQ